MKPSPLDALSIDVNLRRPTDDVLVRCGGRQVTHATFYGRARAARRRLQDLEVGGGDLVLITGDRSDELFVWIVVALDMRTPFVLLRRDALEAEADRVRDALHPRAVIHADGGQPHEAARIEVLDRADTVDAMVNPSVAYMISTSGTTGVPKVVIIGRAQLNAYLGAIVETYSLSSRDVVLSAATVGFDVLLEELLPTLLSGATVSVLDGELGSKSFEETSSLLASEQVTLCNFPSSYFVGWVRALLDAPVAIPSLRAVIAGSEPLPITAVLDAGRCGLSDIEVFNAYGTSETTITSTVWTTTASGNTTGHTAPIGSPIAGCEVRIDDPDGSAGSALGELLIGGPTVALGYLGASAEESARFAPGVLADGSPTTWYRTGDLVSLRDGQLWHMGRVDAQLNIRGVRVEPAEIAAAVGQVVDCEGVEICQVGERLVACVLRPRAEVHAPWRDDLVPLLRAERIPTEIRAFQEFPKLASGKTDAAALRAAVTARAVQVRKASAITQVKLCELIAGVLDLESVSVDDDLFKLGARSIELARIVALVNEACGPVLRLTDLFANPAVAAIFRLAVDRAEGA